MYKEKLEVRGINQDKIISYIILLGAQPNQKNELHFSGDQWTASVSEEQFFRFLQSDVPKVFVTFTAEENDILKDLIILFRKMTFRAGG